MKRLVPVLLILLLFSSHDMFLKLDQYLLEPNAKTTIALYNGTYELSDNVITRDRMQEVSVVANGQRTRIDSSEWYEKDKTTYLNLTTGEAGTYVVGVSTKARDFGQSAESFNGYLEHDGVLDMLEQRKQNGTLGDSAVERYSKHVKTIFQVGDERTDNYKTQLGYPIEFVLLDNPYDMHPGHALRVKLLFNQQPLANQLVYLGREGSGHTHTHDGSTHSHDEDGGHNHDDLIQLRTNVNGRLKVPISSEGIYYLKTIHLVENNEEGLTHESNWATVTFAIADCGHDLDHEHSDDHGHSHDHDHDHDEGIPTYIWVIISILLIAILYLLFDRKKKD